MRLALLGSRQGPWVSIQGMKHPMLNVTGLDGDTSVRVRVGEAVFWIDTNGRHKLVEGDWAICDVVQGNHRRIICHILNARAA